MEINPLSADWKVAYGWKRALIFSLSRGNLSPLLYSSSFYSKENHFRSLFLKTHRKFSGPDSHFPVPP
jgi:hypothetical protein